MRSLRNLVANNTGYTLVELLVVSGILVAVSGIIGGILVSTLRSSDVARSKTQIAQNGNYAMSAMSEVIKRSRDVTSMAGVSDFAGCVGGPIESDTITLLMPEGNEAELTCSDPSGRVASRSGDMTYFLTSEDTSIVSGSCKISCNQASKYSPPLIEIKFQLGVRDDSTGEVFEGSEESFQTQISSRNYINK